MSVEGWEMYVKIDIADTGIGISEQHQGTIFKPSGFIGKMWCMMWTVLESVCIWPVRL